MNKSILLFYILATCYIPEITTQNYPGNKPTTIYQSNLHTNSSNPEEGIVFFSANNGSSWENRSTGLPPDIFLSDIAISDDLLGVSTKQHGIYLYNFTKNAWEETAGEPDTGLDIDALFFTGNQFYAGSQGDGVFVSADKGHTWQQLNNGLENLTIRRFAEIKNNIYVGTNGGLYRLNKAERKWEHLFGDKLLQVNGIIEFEDEIYIGTNKGVFKSSVNQNEWTHVFSGISLHNISSANVIVYALAYNELFQSKNKGQTWESAQFGIPKGKYSFQLRQNNGVEFVGQWDGIYTKDLNNNWKLLHTGIPDNEAITEMNIFRGMLVASSSHWIKTK